ncbi:MAG: DoxX family protein [Firmicutes bacterium]|nr:DoxX family protein [Bacillota bacterium]MCL5038782.1 DoxX family protein [Bacillota bacterium]
MNILKDRRFSVIWLLLRVWLGYQWLEAGLHKVGDPKWMQTGEALKGFWMKAAGLLPNSQPAIKYGWYKSFIEGLVKSGSQVWFGKLVALGEMAVGLALILGLLTTFAAVMGAFMNLNFMLAGSSSTNPVLYTLAILLILGGSNVGYWGLDRFVLTYLKGILPKGKPSPA